MRLKAGFRPVSQTIQNKHFQIHLFYRAGSNMIHFWLHIRKALTAQNLSFSPRLPLKSYHLQSTLLSLYIFAVCGVTSSDLQINGMVSALFSLSSKYRAPSTYWERSTSISLLLINQWGCSLQEPHILVFTSTLQLDSTLSNVWIWKKQL